MSPDDVWFLLAVMNAARNVKNTMPMRQPLKTPKKKLGTRDFFGGGLTGSGGPLSSTLGALVTGSISDISQPLEVVSGVAVVSAGSASVVCDGAACPARSLSESGSTSFVDNPIFRSFQSILMRRVRIGSPTLNALSSFTLLSR